MCYLVLVLVIATAAAKSPEQTEEETLQKLRKMLSEKLSRPKPLEPTQRKSKSYGYYPYYQNMLQNFNNYPDLGYFFPQGKTPVPQEWRTEPFKRKTTTQLLDSPIYYVRLPPSPYVFVPGMGFVSRPPSLNEPGVLDNMPEKPSSNNDEISPENFLHVPIDFVSNGKPTNVYQLPNEMKPKPQKPVYSLDKGPYTFNGKPIELYVLQNSYNNMYADALTNFYP